MKAHKAMTIFYVQRTNEVPDKPFTLFARHGNRRDDAEYVGDYATRQEAIDAATNEGERR